MNKLIKKSLCALTLSVACCGFAHSQDSKDTSNQSDATTINFLLANTRSVDPKGVCLPTDQIKIPFMIQLSKKTSEDLDNQGDQYALSIGNDVYELANQQSYNTLHSIGVRGQLASLEEKEKNARNIYANFRTWIRDDKPIQYTLQVIEGSCINAYRNVQNQVNKGSSNDKGSLVSIKNQVEDKQANAQKTPGNKIAGSLLAESI